MAEVMEVKYESLKRCIDRLEGDRPVKNRKPGLEKIVYLLWAPRDKNTQVTPSLQGGQLGNYSEGVGDDCCNIMRTRR